MLTFMIMDLNIFYFLNQEYSELLDEFMAAVRQNYGLKVLVQVWKIVENKLFVSY